MINNIRVKDAMESFLLKKSINLDIDNEHSNALMTQPGGASIAIYDNYMYN